MYCYLPNATCMVCEKSGSGYFKQIGKKLVCKKCCIMNMIFGGASPDEVKKEVKKDPDQIGSMKNKGPLWPAHLNNT